MKYLLSFLLGISCSVLAAQPDTVSRQWLQAGYFGETITHYGASLGYGHELLRSMVPRAGTNSVRIHRLYAEGNLALFFHPDNQAVVSAIPELGYRYTSARGWHGQIALGAGALRTFYLAETWEADGMGGFEEVALGGKWALGSTLSAGIGKTLSRKSNLALYTQLRLINEHGYNQGTLLRPVFQINLQKAF
jgi:hypothetical protein